MSMTDNLIALATSPADALPPRALALARFSFLDWMACGIAGIGEPLAGKLRAMAEAEGGAPVASIIGGGQAPARMAALVNGATSHALDYDDTHFAHVGHLSVGIYPAAQAAAEQTGASLRATTEAFLVGAEAAIRIGIVLGRAHYNLGFHQTATAGAFGAAIAAGRLYGLDEGQMRAAIGLCATRASGLKSQFGTMGKPYNAGIAAANGVEAAQLAKLGFTSADDGLMGPQGFVPTHTPEPDPQAGWDVPPGERFLFEDNRYKFHACCHGTHAMLEALIAARRQGELHLGNVAGLTLRTNPRWLSVCDLKAPRTGLEVKFSYAWLAGMALRGDATGDDRAYLDALCTDPELAAFAHATTVTGDDGLSDLEAEGHLTLTDGTTVPFSHDLAAPLTEAELTEKLREKARAMIGDFRAGAVWRLHGEAQDDVPAFEIGRLLRKAATEP